MSHLHAWRDGSHRSDHWGLDHPCECILVGTAGAPDPATVDWMNPRLGPGERCRVVTGIPGKTGIVFTLDREAGEFPWTTQTISQNVVNRIAGVTGEEVANSEVVFSAVG